MSDDDNITRKSPVFTESNRFKRGNPGRPKGARNKTTMLLEALFNGEAGEIGRKAVELAKEGHATAMKLVLERACPARRGRPMDAVELPEIKSPADVLAAAHTVTRAVSQGALTPDEARTLVNLIEAVRKTYELVDIDRRLTALENDDARERTGEPR